MAAACRGQQPIPAESSFPVDVTYIRFAALGEIWLRYRSTSSTSHAARLGSFNGEVIHVLDLFQALGPLRCQNDFDTRRK